MQYLKTKLLLVALSTTLLLPLCKGKFYRLVMVSITLVKYFKVKFVNVLPVEAFSLLSRFLYRIC